MPSLFELQSYAMSVAAAASPKHKMDLVATYEDCEVLRCPTTGFFSATRFLTQAKSKLPEAAKCELRTFMRLSRTCQLLKSYAQKTGVPAFQTMVKSTLLEGSLMFAFIQYVSPKAADALEPFFTEFVQPEAQPQAQAQPQATDEDDDDLNEPCDFRDVDHGVADDFTRIMEENARFMKRMLDKQDKLRKQVEQNHLKQQQSLDVIVEYIQKKRKRHEQKEADDVVAKKEVELIDCLLKKYKPIR
jgi:hypothetical protein